MPRRNPLIKLMSTPLPSITEQKRKLYRPSLKEANHIYNLLNKYVFDKKLTRPIIHLKSHRRKYWGMCIGYDIEVKNGTRCEIELMDKFFCIQWFITTLAHEMCHQYEHDILKKTMTHRKNFFIHRTQLAKYGIDLKTAHGQKRWFKYQNFKKC